MEPHTDCVFSGMASKIDCQSGSASSAAGFHQKPSQTPRSGSQPEVTEPLSYSTSTSQQLAVNHRGSLGDEVTALAQTKAVISAGAAQRRPSASASGKPAYREESALHRNSCHRVQLKPHQDSPIRSQRLCVDTRLRITGKINK